MTPRNQFAPVASLDTYKKLFTEDLGNYQLLIATEVVKNPDAWGEFWLGEVHTEQFIIMDNGLIETGKATDTETIRGACAVTAPSCVVLPDTLGDFKATLKAVNSVLPEYRKIGVPLMGVVQGQNIEEVEAILKFYVSAEVEYLSIPRVMVDYFTTRRYLVERARWYGKPIHLLGWSEDVNDDLRCAAMDGVMGIDSAVPIWYPNYFPTVPTSDGRISGKRPEYFWDMTPNSSSMARIENNIRWTRSWIEAYAKDVRSAAGA